MTKDVIKYVKSCLLCQKNKSLPKNIEPLLITQTPNKAFDTVIIDTIGPFITSNHGNEYAVTIMCDLSKYLIAIPVPSKDAKTIAKAIFENLILTYGPPKKILTDKGTEYKNDLMNNMCVLLGIDQRTSTAYHHETLGTVERSHRTFNEFVRSYLTTERIDWDDWLKYFAYCFNTTPSTVHGYCPFELVYGKLPTTLSFLEPNVIEPIYNIDAYEKEIKFRLQTAQARAKALIEKAKLKQKSYYDENVRSSVMRINDLVLLENSAGHKLESLYTGPFRITDVDKYGNCTLKISDSKSQKVHKNRLKKYND